MENAEGQNKLADKVLKRIDLLIDVLIEDRKLAVEDRKLAAEDRKQAEKDRKEMTRAVLLGGRALLSIDKRQKETLQLLRGLKDGQDETKNLLKQGQKETTSLLREILRHIKIQGNSHGSNNNK